MSHYSKKPVHFKKIGGKVKAIFEHKDAKNVDKINTPQEKAKVERVLHEYKEGELRSSSGQKVTNRKQAVAIALSEGRVVKDNKASTKKLNTYPEKYNYPDNATNEDIYRAGIAKNKIGTGQDVSQGQKLAYKKVYKKEYPLPDTPLENAKAKKRYTDYINKR